MPRRLVILALLPLIGCGASREVAADASAEQVVDGHVDRSEDAPMIASDAGLDVAFIDSSLDLPDVEVPATCDAGDYFVTVDDGTRTNVLRRGCLDSGLDVPWIDLRSGGNVCDVAYLYACSPAGARFNIVDGCIGPYIPAGPTLAPVEGTYDDGNGQLLAAVGAVRFATAPPEGGTVPGGYVFNLRVPDGGGDAGTISGTFCVLYEGMGYW